MTENEQQIANVQRWLDRMADEIDYSLETDGEDDNQFALCMRILHARASASLHLLKKGIQPKELKKL